MTNEQVRVILDWTCDSAIPDQDAQTELPNMLALCNQLCQSNKPLRCRLTEELLEHMIGVADPSPRCVLVLEAVTSLTCASDVAAACAVAGLASRTNSDELLPPFLRILYESTSSSQGTSLHLAWRLFLHPDLVPYFDQGHSDQVK